MRKRLKQIERELDKLSKKKEALIKEKEILETKLVISTEFERIRHQCISICDSLADYNKMLGIAKCGLDDQWVFYAYMNGCYEVNNIDIDKLDREIDVILDVYNIEWDKRIYYNRYYAIAVLDKLPDESMEKEA